jgi:hypothetical protein
MLLVPVKYPLLYEIELLSILLATVKYCRIILVNMSNTFGYTGYKICGMCDLLFSYNSIARYRKKRAFSEVKDK